MIKRIIDFFKESYQLSPLAFYSELAEAALFMSASTIAAWTASDPASGIMWYAPMFLAGGILGVISTVIRRAGFAILLTVWAVLAWGWATLQVIIV